MWGRSVPARRADVPALGDVDLHEGAMLAAQAAEGVERLDHARALRPAAAGAAGQGDHRHRALRPMRPCPDRARRAGALWARRSPVQAEIVDLAGRHILDGAADGQPVLGQADTPAAQVGLDLRMLRAVEAVLIEQRGQALPLSLRWTSASGSSRSKSASTIPARRGLVRRRGPEAGKLGAAEGRKAMLLMAQQDRARSGRSSRGA